MSSAHLREVASPANSLVKVFRRALAEGITKQGWLGVEGPFLVEEALSAAPLVKTQSVLVASGAVQKHAELLARVPSLVELTQVPDRIFQSIAPTQSPQGIAALVELPRYEVEQVVSMKTPLLVVACRLQDPGNLGTLMRSALAFSATGLLALRDTVSPCNPKAVRSSAGAIFRLPVIGGLDANQVLPYLGKRVKIFAAEASASVPVTQADFRGPTAILVGREAGGLTTGIARYADQRCRIPIRQDVDSLNAATAASIFLYEAARQRGFRY